jgi:spore coat protein A, manganese oxidase
MKINQKKFLRNAATAVLGVAVLVGVGVLSAQAFNQSPQIPLFQTTLRGVGPGGIPVAKPGPLPAPVTGVTHYEILMSQFQDQILPLGFNKTTLWGYNPLFPLGGGNQPQKHLGGVIVGKGRNPNDTLDKNVPIQISFQNLLFVNKHIIPVDTTIPGANQAINRTAIHLHGGNLPWISDGGPFDWFGPIDDHGMSFLNNKVLNPLHLPGSAEYYYPLNQSARFMWYHDHAFGITRLNAYAGLATAMLIRDNFEAGLIDGSSKYAPGVQGLPPFIETSVLSKGTIPVQELPLVFQDKIFVGPNTCGADPGWCNGAVNLQAVTKNNGSLWYAHTYEANQADGSGRWDLWAGALALPDPSNIPEFFGDTMLVNGTVFPEATVQARRYRLRMLNACNARFLNLQLYIDDGSKNGITLNGNGVPANTPFANPATGGTSWLQIGTEGGFLSKATKIPSNVPFLITDENFLAGGPSLDPTKVNKSLVVAPAERTDLIVDFSGVAVGTKVVLYNDAPAPFPSGDDRNDYFPGWNVGSGLSGVGNPVNRLVINGGTAQDGYGPNTRVLMRFVVTKAASSDTPLTITDATDLTGGIDPALNHWGDTVFPSTVTKRFMSLNEYFDERGRLIQIIGNDLNPYGSPYDTTSSYYQYGVPPASGQTSVGAFPDTVHAGDTEVWEVYNTTGDVHPMHFHLVNVQVINREIFDPASGYPYTLSGAPIPPAANELGWKETVPMYPGTVTRVMMKWDLNAAKIVDKNRNPITTKPNLVGRLLGQIPIVGGQPPVSPRTGGFEYVWHCHILEHEEHDMMHALVVN